MVLGIISAVVALAAAVVACGLPRINLPRTAGLEGIEDLDAAQAYDRISRWPQFRLLRRIIARELARYRPEGSLADIGCGPGRLVMLIAQRHPHLRVVGLDAADEMIRAASLNVSSQNLSDRVEFRKGDVSNLPLPDGTLDFVVSTLSLHHWSHPSHGLGQMHRVLRPGGQVLLFDLRRDPRRFFYWLLRFAQAIVVPTGLRRIGEPLGSLLSSYTVAELEGLLGRSKFTEWRIAGGAGWVFVWARKQLREIEIDREC